MNADIVARHLVMAGRLLDEDPEAAYLHATAAAQRAGRVGAVREAAGLAAYRRATTRRPSPSCAPPGGSPGTTRSCP